jgi:GINS complex protein
MQKFSRAMTPEELINLSLQQEVEIEAHTSIPKTTLITYDFPGCHPLKVSRIPLYIALHLKSSNSCTIRMPVYLSKEFLSSLIEKEQRDRQFVEVPEYLFEHAYLFMSNEIESLICELKRIRQNKIWKGLKDMDGKALYINGLTKWEFNEVKEAITSAMRIGKTIEHIGEQ